MASFSGLYDMMTSQYSYTSPLSYISYITPVFHWIWWIISWGIFSSKQKKNRVRPNQVECVYIHIGRSSNWEDPSTWDEEKDISILFGYSINLTICYLSRQKQALFCLTYVVSVFSMDLHLLLMKIFLMEWGIVLVARCSRFFCLDILYHPYIIF